MRRRKLCNEIFERILSDTALHASRFEMFGISVESGEISCEHQQQTSLHGKLPQYEIYHAYNLDIKNIFSKRIEFDVKNCFCFD